MKKVRPAQACLKISDSPLSFKTTRDLKPLEGIIGQERALEALKLGLEIKQKGFNIFVTGEPGTGRTSAVKAFLEEKASKMPVPDDLCFVHNFNDSYSPIPLFLRTGLAQQVNRELEKVLEKAVSFIRNIREYREFKDYIDHMQKEYRLKEQQILASLKEQMKTRSFNLKITEKGMMTVPVVDGKEITPEEFEKLPQDKKKELIQKHLEVEKLLRKAGLKKEKLEERIVSAIETKKRRIIEKKIKSYFAPLKRKYARHKPLVRFLNCVIKDLVEQHQIFEKGEEKADEAERILKRYFIHVAVDNSRLKGAPVIIENNPTFQNLIGRIEKEGGIRGYTTDFTLIKAGSLLRANGGFLILHAEDVLSDAVVWKSLKRSLINMQVQIEDLESRMNLVSIKTLRPLPVPINLKVILIGSPLHYSLLHELDTEFREVFKVKAEFDWTMDLTKENIRKFIRLAGTLARKEGLRPLTSEAIRELLSFASRQADSQKKFSTNFGLLSDIMREADFYAEEERCDVIKEEHIRRAIDNFRKRLSLIKDKIFESIRKNVVKIETSGERVGQINGLTYMEVDGLSFGKPVKITATTGAGKEGIVNIEREAALSGPIHTKGVLILSGYLTEEFAKEIPLNLNAKLVFEQTYTEIDGDSATAAELIAILSSLTGIPIKQNLAITGSMSQKGEIQAVGGINEKIEGFFEVCKLKGLRGDEGVIIPEDNLENLNLNDEVIKAMEEGKFHIYAVKHIKEAIKLLMEASYSELKKKVRQKLMEFSKKAKD